jgi:dynactin complex subunit
MKTQNLVSLKKAVIKYHDANPYLELAMARDACFTSYNAVDWKNSQMSDVAAEIKDLMPQRGQEITDVKLEKLLSRYESMEIESNTLTERHNADKEVYADIAKEHGLTPAIWSHKPKRTYTSDGQGLDSRLAKFA